MPFISRPFSRDPFTGLERDFHYDPDTGDFHIETRQRVSSVLDANKAEFAAHDEHTPWGDGQKVASIPMGLYWELRAKGITKDQKAFRKWLNDPDNRFFRTRPGRV